MDLIGWILTFAGAAVLVLVLLDVTLAVLHMDLPAPLERMLQRAIWSVTLPLATRGETPRRAWVALAGPLMVLGTLVMWGGLFVFGFALLVWPVLSTAFTVDPALEPAGLLDALYYSTITITTLGYGDISPVTAYAQVLSILEAILGFFMLAGVFTYLFTTLQGVFERNALALRLHASTLQTGDGVALVVRSLQYEELVDLRERYMEIAAAMRNLEEHFHGYPILAFYYRNIDTDHDPEPMLRAAIEIVIAGRLLQLDGPLRRLHPAVEDLEYVVLHFMGVLANQYMGEEVSRMLESPQPGPADRRWVESLRTRLRDAVPERCRTMPDPDDQPALELAASARAFLTALDDVTGWSAFHPHAKIPGEGAAIEASS